MALANGLVDWSPPNRPDLVFDDKDFYAMVLNVVLWFLNIVLLWFCLDSNDFLVYHLTQLVLYLFFMVLVVLWWYGGFYVARVVLKSVSETVYDWC